MWDRSASSVLNVNQAAGDRKKKASSSKSGVKNKSKNGNVYSSEGLTCGTDLPAASSTLTRRQGIERKRQVARNQGSKINPRMETFIVQRG